MLITFPFPDKAFDVSLCSEVLEHVVDPAAVLAELKRVTGVRLCSVHRGLRIGRPETITFGTSIRVNLTPISSILLTKIFDCYAGRIAGFSAQDPKS